MPIISKIKRIPSKLEKIRKITFPVNTQEIQASLHGQKILINSIPKSGTHLLKNVVSQFPMVVPRWSNHILNSDHERDLEYHRQELYPKLLKMQRGQCLSCHFARDQDLIDVINKNDIKCLFIHRDLRDVVVSTAFYLAYMTKSHISSYLKSLNSDDEIIMKCILGIDENEIGIEGNKKRWPSLRERCELFLPWLNEANILKTRFEDLVGESGGGSRDKQFETVMKIAQFLEYDLTEHEITTIADQAFSSRTITFRKGQIGDWQNHFTDEHKKVFKEMAGEYLIALGYTKDYDW